MLEEEVGVDPNTFRYRPFSRRGHRPLWFIFLIDLPQGLEPWFSGPKPGVLPIRRGEKYEANMSKNFFFFWGSYQGRTDDSGLQSRDITKLY